MTLLLRQNWIFFGLILSLLCLMWWFMVNTLNNNDPPIHLYLGMIWFTAIFIKISWPGQSLLIDSSGIFRVDLTWLGIRRYHYHWSSIQRIEYSGKGFMRIIFRLHPQEPVELNFFDYYTGFLWVNGSLRFSLLSALPLQTMKEICHENNVPLMIRKSSKR